MSILRKEHSTVRFAKGTNTLPKLTHMYRPELHRQVTERMPVSRLGHELTQLCQTGLGEAFDARAMAQAKLELNELMDKMLLSLKRNKVGLDVKTPIMLHCFSHWHVTPETSVVCLIPVAVHKAKVIQTDIGHVLIKLPPADSTGQQDNNSRKSISTSSSSSEPLADIRTKDGLHVSPRKLHAAVTNLVLASLLKHGVSKDKMLVSLEACELTMTLLLDCGWRAELVPCVKVVVTGRSTRTSAADSPAVDNDDVYYVFRRFSTELYEKGDITWRPCSSVRDQDLLRSISSTDNGLRVKALFAICRLVSRDWRLQHITCYHVQTALLHDMDFHVDYSPRWQRSTLESCVRSLLKTLLYFVDRESLPHFDLNQLNLWEDMTQRQLTLARGALNRLLANENALISLVRRASNKTSASADFGLFSWS